MRVRSLWLGLVACVFVTTIADRSMANARMRMLVFPIKADAGAGTTEDEAFTQTQLLTANLQAGFVVHDFDPDDIWIKQAYLLGLLTSADLHFTEMTPELAYKMLGALAQNLDAKQDVALWGVYTKVDDVDALRLTIIDLRCTRYIEQTIDASAGNIYEKAVAWAVEAIDKLRSGDIGSAPGAPGDGGTHPDGVGTTSGPGPTPPAPGGLSPEEANSKGWELITQAENLDLHKLFPDAISSSLEAESLNPTDEALRAEIANTLYQVYEHSGDMENALKWVVIAGERASDDKKEILSRQEAHLRQLVEFGRGGWDTPRSDLTIAALEDWLRLHSAETGMRRTLITKYMELQPTPNWQMAEKHLELLLDRTPRVPQARLRLATCQLRLGRPKDAVSTLTEWRNGWPSSFDQDGMLLMAEAKAANGQPAEAIAELVATVSGDDVPLSLGEQRYLVLVSAIESVLRAHLPGLVAALGDARTILAQGEPAAGRPREDVRAALSDVSPQFSDLQKLLDAVLPLEGLAKWQEHMTRAIELMRQALAEAVYALDAGDSRACTRSIGTWGLASAEVDAAVEARQDYAPTNEKPEDSTPDRVIGL